MNLKELNFSDFEELDDYIQCTQLNKLIAINTKTDEKCYLVWSRYVFGELERILLINMITHEIYYDINDDFDDYTFSELMKYYKFYKVDGDE